MRRFFLGVTMLLGTCVLLSSCGAPATNNAANKPANAPANNANAAAPANTAAAEADVKKLIADVYAALPKADTAALEKLYDDKYVVVDIDGSVQDKAGRLATLKSGDVKFESISADEITVRVNAEGTGAVSIARATVKSERKGVKSDGTVRVTTVWSKTKDGWKAVGAHATRITDAAPAQADDKANTNATKPAANAPANK